MTINEKVKSTNSLVKENMDLKSKVYNLYNKLKNGEECSLNDTSHIELILSQESESKIHKLNAQVTCIEKDNKHLLTKLTEAQNKYESQIQETNILKNSQETSMMEIERLNKLVATYQDSVKETEDRISFLTQERSKLDKKFNEQELKLLQAKNQCSVNEDLEFLKQENELFK